MTEDEISLGALSSMDVSLSDMGGFGDGQGSLASSSP